MTHLVRQLHCMQEFHILNIPVVTGISNSEEISIMVLSKFQTWLQIEICFWHFPIFWEQLLYKAHLCDCFCGNKFQKMFSFKYFI